MKAVKPYIYKNNSNFKQKPFVAWKRIGGGTVEGHYPKVLHKLLYTYDCFPPLYQRKDEVRLCFVQPYSLYFDTWSSVMTHEVVPFVWDCWEEYDEMFCFWIVRHKIRRCVFTSYLSAERIKKKLPQLDILVITEGIDVDGYVAGKELVDREIDFYWYGRQPQIIYQTDFTGLNVASHGNGDEFRERLQNSKATIAVPRCDVVPTCHETLTQRYWECMLSRMVMVGRAPRELTELIGYNPVIDIDYNNLCHQIKDITSNIEKYQSLVDRNRGTALLLAPWEIKMRKIMDWMEAHGYQCVRE